MSRLQFVNKHDAVVPSSQPPDRSAIRSEGGTWVIAHTQLSVLPAYNLEQSSVEEEEGAVGKTDENGQRFVPGS